MTSDVGSLPSFSKAVIAPDTSPSSGFQGTPFTGTFDGNGHKIIRLFIGNGTGDAYLGLFGQIGTGGVIKNLGLERVLISASGSYLVSGLVGKNYGNLNNCYSTGSVGAYGDAVGGLVADNYGTVLNCWSSCSVSGRNGVGGLAGSSHGSISNCYSTGNVSGSDFEEVGGLVGVNWSGSVSNCWSNSTVSSRAEVGGLVGLNFRASVTNSYSTGAVNGSNYVGGLVGRNLEGTVTGNFWDTQTSNCTTSAGGTGKTTAEMQTQSTFTWDFVSTWGICEGTNYPRLLWQIPATDWICPDGVSTEDFAHFVQWWLVTDCGLSGDCDGTDINGDGTVDLSDFAVFSEYWMEGT